jgi:hypothetical protein
MYHPLTELIIEGSVKDYKPPIEKHYDNIIRQWLESKAEELGIRHNEISFRARLIESILELNQPKSLEDKFRDISKEYGIDKGKYSALYYDLAKIAEEHFKKDGE